jgi:hypothetical protein
MVIHSKALRMPELSHNIMFYNDVFANLMALVVGRGANRAGSFFVATGG